jgi:enoyl-[acyl-carrier protein] reductase II
MMGNKVAELFRIDYPIIQAGMIWCSGWELASAVSNAGGLGLIGSGSMTPEILQMQVAKCKMATSKPFGVNVPLLFPAVSEFMKIIVDEGVKIVFTSAGTPAKWTPFLKEHGITVVHVVANVKSAKKCEEAGVDAIVAEGFEAGGHNGKEETTTMVLIPMVREAVSLPLIAAGGIASGRAMLAAMALGADGVQIGSRFAASEESSGHPAFKQKIVEAKDGDTFLTLKKIVPVRLIRNKFYNDVETLQNRGASSEELLQLLGHGRSRKGMFEGDTEEGELEIGQVAGLIHGIQPAAQIVKEILTEFEEAKADLTAISF